jgi:hypothetical protein
LVLKIRFLDFKPACRQAGFWLKIEIPAKNRRDFYCL